MSANTQPSNTNDSLDGSEALAKDDSDEELLKQAREHYRLCCANDSENREQAVADLLFLTGGENQWDARAVALRKADGRPIITVNQLPAFLHQVTNDQRMNTPSIKVHPVAGADEQSAKVRQGMIRHIEYDSNAGIAYDRAVNSAAAIGAGYWYLDTEYESGASFNQKICFRSVRNALSVRIDPLSTEPDGADMGYCFVEGLVARSDFKQKYPDANANDPTWFSNGEQSYSAWLKEDSVLVCRYYYVKTEKATAVEMTDGSTGWKDTLPKDLPLGISIKRERQAERRKVNLCIITGVDVLEKTEILCRWIPVFPVYGDEIDIEGRVIRNGIVRHAKGPAQSYNVMMSGATEEISLRSKAPYIGAVGTFETDKEAWAQANNRAFSSLEYDPIDVNGTLAPPPQRQPMADIPTGMLAMAMHAADNVKKTTGLFDASLGARGSATSGKQELAQQREGDVSNFHFSDNLNRSVLQCGRCINDMIPHYYDAERIVQIMRPDDSVESVTINQRLPAPIQDKKTGAVMEVLNDMTGGEFSVTMSAGPSYTTMRQESQEFFTSAMQAAKDPVTNAIVTYLAMRNSDAPGADEATKMIKTLLPQSAQQAIDDGEKGPGQQDQEEMIQTPRGPLPVSQVPQVLMQLEQQLQQQGEALQKANVDKQAESASKAQESAAKAQAEILRQQNEGEKLRIEGERLRIEQFEAETERQKVDDERAKAERDSLIDAETQDTERMRIEREAEQSSIESERTASEVAERESAPSIEDMAQLIIKSRANISGMQIKAPSGGVYDVAIQNETVQ